MKPSQSTELNVSNRAVAPLVRRAAHLSRRFLHVLQNDGLGPAWGRASRKLRVLGRRARSRFSSTFPAGFAEADPYEAWTRRNRPNPRRAERLAEALAQRTRSSRFSIVTPVYNTPEAVLDAAVSSVVDQSHADWELILVNDASTREHVSPALRRWASRDARIRLIERPENGGIAVATNTGAAVAAGAFLVLLDHDDALDVDCLAHLALAVDGGADDVDLVYSDHDKIGLDGRRFAPEFKPDWSPELLLSFCYASHVKTIRTALYHELGGLREGFEGSQDHDLLLRASERARRVVHVPQLLYHWRVLPGSTAAGGREKPASLEAGRRAVQEAFNRRGVDCDVTIPAWAERDGSAVFRPMMRADGPSVAVLTTAEDLDASRGLLSWLGASIYEDLHVYIVGGDSRKLKIDEDRRPFQTTAVEGEAGPRAAVWNRLVERIDEDLILFLNGRSSPEDPALISQLVGWLGLEGVGAVGPRVVDGKGSVVSVGLAVDSESGAARGVFDGLPSWDQGSLNLAGVARNVSALSDDCILTSRRTFNEMGGFDAEAFPDQLFVVDYCLRLGARGLRCVVAAEAEVVAPRPDSPRRASPRELAAFRSRYSNDVEPYLSPHLDGGSAELRVRPTVVPCGPPSRPLRILAASHNLRWEGAPLIQLELLAALSRSSRVSAVVVGPTDGPLRAEYEKEGVAVEIRPSLDVATGSADRLEAEIETLGRWIVDGGFDCLHANTLQTFWAVLAARRAGLASVWSVHESEPWRTYFADLPPRVAGRALGALTTPYRVVFASRGSLDAWKDLNAQANFMRISTPLDLARFQAKRAGADRASARRSLGIDRDDVCILALGTVCERKGQLDLVEAFRRLPDGAAGRARCIVVGLRKGIEYGRELERRIAALPAERRDRFQVIPETGETAPYWAAADLFCCTSRVESYPRVVLEAMAVGLPLVTTPVFGIAEQARDGINALFYDPGDAAGLAERLEIMIGDDARRLRFAAESPRVLGGLPDHGWFVDQYEALFRASAESRVEPPEGSGELQTAVGLTPRTIARTQ